MKSSTKWIVMPLVLMPVLGLTLAGKPSKEAHNEKIKRGKYLVEAGGCTDCHTPMKMGPKGPEPDMAFYLAGHPENAKLPPPPKLAPGPWMAVTTGSTAWSGPWGISYSANITSDENTALGIWTEDIFVKTIRTGKHYGTSRDILPPMPWQSVAKLSDEDLKAIFAYLKSVPAVKNHVPEPQAPGEVASAKNKFD
ncbi:c-type cytochrome [Pedosphaera parvula]|uniref:Putative lipoprotein n=1 Tax=Pedosphaera parvula (strain Ellin514) TaxID=320771 RepID=B9XHA1_PEDPL|nr:c-type cytochrome [Pedosphaera parvula]EEF60736.1 putative lipoprotein [Pedosphaera parvula Ellin514]